MTTVNGYHPGTSVVFVQQPKNKESTRASIVPVYLLNGVQVRNWRLSFSQVILCLTCGIMFFLIGIFLIGRGVTKQGFFKNDPNAHRLDIGFGSTISILGALMIAAFLGMCCYARNKYNTLKESGIQDTYAYQNPIPVHASNCHVVVMP